MLRSTRACGPAWGIRLQAYSRYANASLEMQCVCLLVSSDLNACLSVEFGSTLRGARRDLTGESYLLGHCGMEEQPAE